MQMKVSRETAVRKRLSLLWKVEPYRIDVEVIQGGLKVLLDGTEPNPEQVRIFEEDIRTMTEFARRNMN